MNAVIESILRRPGAFVFRQWSLARDITAIGVRAVRGLRSLCHPAVLRVFLRQLYFTSIQPLPLVVGSALVMGAVIVHYVVSFFTSVGIREEIGRFILLVIVNELASVFVAVIVMIRSGSAIISEIALMKLNRELDTLDALGIDEYEYLFSPRFAAIIISNMLLAVLFCIVALVGGFLSYGYLNNVPFYDYMQGMANSATPMDFVSVYFKSFVFGATIVLVSIHDGLGVRHSISEVPVRLIHGLVIQVMAILFFDLIYDVVRYGLII